MKEGYQSMLEDDTNTDDNLEETLPAFFSTQQSSSAQPLPQYSSTSTGSSLTHQTPPSDPVMSSPQIPVITLDDNDQRTKTNLVQKVILKAKKQNFINPVELLRFLVCPGKNCGWKIFGYC